MVVRRRLARAGCAAFAAIAAASISMTAPAAAAPGAADARARAAALRAQVDRLQVEAETATERYDAAQAELGSVVTAHLLAQQQLEQAHQSASASADQLAGRVRALYMAGGQVALLATVLDADSLQDAVARVRDVQSVVADDASGRSAAQETAAGAAAIEQRLGALAARRTRLEADAAHAAESVRSLLDEQQQLLGQADAEVRRIAAAQAAAAQAAAAAQFAARLAAAQASAGIDPSLAGSTAPPNAVVAAAIAAARTKLGVPYVWGGSGPDVFDCSGLTQWAYARAGVALPRVAADQWYAGPHPSLANLAPGDLLFWATDTSNPATIYHEGLYIGGDLMIVAPHTGDVVKVQQVYLSHFIGATRPTAAMGGGRV